MHEAFSLSGSRVGVRKRNLSWYEALLVPWVRIGHAAMIYRVNGCTSVRAAHSNPLRHRCQGLSVSDTADLGAALRPCWLRGSDDLRSHPPSRIRFRSRFRSHCRRRLRSQRCCRSSGEYPPNYFIFLYFRLLWLFRSGFVTAHECACIKRYELYYVYTIAVVRAQDPD